ncbi:unnamed protein product [Durusdinium trenchii]|uniref:Uncharacterized protein n=1 Tax=Durusdinium trenchii TaxID=1381693 RepID=A0ABP0LXI3_9DINO
MNGHAAAHYTYAAPVKGHLANGTVRPPTCHVFVLVRPAAHADALDAQRAGHPLSLAALKAAGAEVKVLRASCHCQGKRLLEEGAVYELAECGRTLRFEGHAINVNDAARSLTHLRAWHEATEVKNLPVVVLLAESIIQGPSALWAQQVVAACRSGQPLLSLGHPPLPHSLEGGYAMSAGFLQRLKLLLPSLKAKPSAEMAQSLFRLALEQFRLPSVPAAPLLKGGDGPLVPPGSGRSHPPVAGRPHGGIKVVVITLAHRGDRRVDPLVAGPSALAAMREAGFDVEVLRASCYCERDTLEQHGRLLCFFDENHWGNFQRYEGATRELDSEEEEELLDYLNENYEHGAQRLADPEDGDLAGYLRDTNWPGATSCAMSHLRGLVKAATDGHEFALVFEDDAVIPTSVARKRGWCETCPGNLCFCPSAWAFCVEEAVQLMRRAPHLDLLYLGVGEAFEPHGPHEGILSDDSDEELGGITEMGYTWCAEAILYARSALQDVLALKLHERLWAQDETIPHLYSRKPWNPRFMESLKQVGFQRRWLAGAPAEDVEEGWIQQLEFFKEELDSAQLALAWRSSNSSEL